MTMDHEQVETVIAKFAAQGDLSDEQIESAMDEMVVLGWAEKRGAGPSAVFRLTPEGMTAAERVVGRELS